MTFPVVVKTPVHTEPRASLYYEVAENGVFQVRDTLAYRAVTRAMGPIPGLVPECEHLRIRFPRLPRAHVEEVLAFFAEVFRQYRAEAVAVVFYRPGTREFRIGVPPQTPLGRRCPGGGWLAGSAVRYGSVERPAGFLRLGDLHSHGQYPAYASHTDWADEQYEDGLHIVFGSFATTRLTAAADFVANGVRFPLAPSDVLEPFAWPLRPARPEWMAQLVCAGGAEDPGKEGEAVDATAAAGRVAALPEGASADGGAKTEDGHGPAKGPRRGAS